jgi:hypothetical protein
MRRATKRLTISYQQPGAPSGDCSDAGSALNGGHGDRDGQVEAGALLLHVGWGQVDRGAAEGKTAAGTDY